MKSGLFFLLVPLNLLFPSSLASTSSSLTKRSASKITDSSSDDLRSFPRSDSKDSPTDVDFSLSTESFSPSGQVTNIIQDFREIFDMDGVIPTAATEIVDPFESYGNIFDGTVPEDNDSAWKFEEEVEWDIPARNFNQYHASLLDTSLSSLHTVSVINFFKGVYVFDRDWPASSATDNTTAVSDLTRFSSEYQALALMFIFKPAHFYSLNWLVSYDLIDLSRPLFTTETGIYHSFLTVMFLEPRIEPEKFDIILEFSSKTMVNHPSSNGIVPLVYAIRQKRFDLVQKLVVAGADINYTDGTLLTPFMEALLQNQTLTVDYFLTLRAHNPNIILTDGSTALALAFINLTSKKSRDILGKLISNGSTPIDFLVYSTALKQLSTKKTSGFDFLVKSALLGTHSSLATFFAVLYLANQAVINDDVQMIQRLHLLKAPLNLASSQGCLLHIAAHYGSKTVIKHFIKTNFFPIDLISPFEGFTAIQVAHRNNQKHLVMEMIRLGASLGLPGILQEAIQAGDLEIIETLISSRSDSNVFFDLPNGYNLITWSITKDKPEILVRLLGWWEICWLQNDRLGNNIHSVPLPENASMELINTLAKYGK